MTDKKDLAENLKALKERTGVSLAVCKQALDACSNDINQAILWLRENNLVASISKEAMVAQYSAYAENWAADFLETALNTGELRENYEAGRLDVIQENYFAWYVVGMPGKCPYLMFKKELQFLTDDERQEFADEVKELYDKAVERLLSNFVRPDWKMSS